MTEKEITRMFGEPVPGIPTTATDLVVVKDAGKVYVGYNLPVPGSKGLGDFA